MCFFRKEVVKRSEFQFFFFFSSNRRKTQQPTSKLTDDVLEGDRQQVALLDGELLVVDELGYLLKRKKKEEREREEEGEVSFLFRFLPPPLL